jgi:hypothetical protein
MGKEIYARAVPKSITLTETYCYEQEISRNPSIKEKDSPAGKIEVLVPYDGYKYFTRQAIRDVEQQIEDTSSDEEVNALIGYLAISEHDKTDIEDLLSRSKKYESIPLLVSVFNDTFIQRNQLSNDQYFCILKHIYQPKLPELLPIQLNLEVLDDDISLVGLPSPRKILNSLSSENTESLVNLITKQVKSGFVFGDASFRNTLVLYFQIRLSLPLDQFSELTPKVKRLSLQWPTSTSLSNLSLAVNGFKPNKELKYNPITQNLEWFDVQFELEIEKDSQNQSGIWLSQPMYLLIGQPSELYQQVSLNGEIEVEIPGRLLSGLQVRFYGFDQITQKVGNLNDNFLKFTTRIVTNFELILDEAFHKRIKSTSQKLKFDQIFPDEECISIIRNELQNQGFDVPLLQEVSVTSSGREKKFKWLIFAERSEGIDSMTLWIVADGIQFETERTTRRENVIHTSKDKSGELTMYLLGQFPQNSHSLIKKMKALQEELRKKFEKMQRQN